EQHTSLSLDQVARGRSLDVEMAYFPPQKVLTPDGTRSFALPHLVSLASPTMPPGRNRQHPRDADGGEDCPVPATPSPARQPTARARGPATPALPTDDDESGRPARPRKEPAGPRSVDSATRAPSGLATSLCVERNEEKM